MANDKILAYDVGTSGVKAVLTDGRGRVLDTALRSYGIHASNDGSVDQDVDEILAATTRVTRELVERSPDGPGSVVGVSVTGQMFNIVPVDKSGRALAPMLSWLDQRGAPQAVQLARVMSPDEQYSKLGAVITGKDILPKIMWLRDECPDVFRKTAKLLDCKEAVVMHLTGRAVTDVGGAVIYRLLNMQARQWDAPACEAMGIPLSMLPDVEPATAVAGRLTGSAARATGLLAGTPVLVGGGDLPASQVGAGAINVGDGHVALGTSAHFGITVDRLLPDPHRMQVVFGHMDPRLWIVCVEIATAGGALAWFARTLLGLAGSVPVDYKIVERLVTECEDDLGGLVFCPWLSGERVPVFDDRARGAFVGLDLHHGAGHMLRAVMEGVAFQMRWALEYATAYGQPAREIRAVGGGFGDAWTQIIADVLGRRLLRIRDPQDAGAVGAAACALVGLGLQPSFEFIRDAAVVDHVFEPALDSDEKYRRRFDIFRRLYEALRPIYHDAIG